MIALLSPAKTLDFDKPQRSASTEPSFLSKSQRLAKVLKEYSVEDLRSLMSISENLAKLNYDRFQDMSFNPQPESARAALDVFEGDVYKGLEASTMNDDDWTYAQQHIRILSGFYGILRPLDQMQAYRLEMGTKLNIEDEYANLYEFWKQDLTVALNEELKKEQQPLIINLASNEYFKAIDKKKLNAPILNVQFKEWRDGKLKFISFNAKKARGLMARYMIDHKVDRVDDLKGFNTDGYAYEPELSSEKEWMFTREN